MKFSRLLILFIIVNFQSILLGKTAQEYTVKVDTAVVRFDEEHLEAYKKDADFNYLEVEYSKSIFEKFKDWLISMLGWLFNNLGVDVTVNTIKIILNVLKYLILAVLLFLIVKMFLKIKPKNFFSTQKNNNLVQFSDDEHIIKNEDINMLITNALSDGNYRLATRYYFLLLLKNLTQENHIAWEPQKTNKDYYNELNSIEDKQSFQSLTDIYDFVWYGNFEINQGKFHTIEQQFKLYNQKIKHS